MHFLRYQEYYECPSPKFRGKIFTIFDYMEWYTKKYGHGAFSYPRDWGGFNLPGSIPIDIMGKIPDINKYDKEISLVVTKCFQKYPDKRFYLIGAVGKGGAMNHEIAHGFFYTQPEYKKEMVRLVKALPKEFRQNMNKWLKNIGYTNSVFVDEIQAYLSTGMSKDFKLFAWKKYSKPFVKIFEKYNVDYQRTNSIRI